MNTHLIDIVKVTPAITIAAGAAGATDVVGATLDMADADGVLVIVNFGPITAGAVTSFKLQQGAASDLSDAADLAGTQQAVADDEDNTSRYVDLLKPAERYVRVYVDRATQNATLNATYIQYKLRKCPPAAQGTGITGGEKHETPAEGTA